MAVILLIETATPVCSVALSGDGQLLAIKESNEQNIHSSVITVFIEQAAREAGYKLRELDAVAVSMGPGSYTGLRIGVSTAKGLCYALDIPLIAVQTLKSMANGARDRIKENSKSCREKILLCPMIDARRMEVYSALYDTDLKEIQPASAKIIDQKSFSDYLRENCVYFFGNGAPKCRDALGTWPNARFLDDFIPSARFMISLAQEKYNLKKFEDLAYFEPFYLKDFIAGKPKVKGLL